MLYDTKLKIKLLDNNYKHSVQRRRSLPRKGICKAPYTNDSFRAAGHIMSYTPVGSVEVGTDERSTGGRLRRIVV
jgi:hypothetical protein